MPIYHKLGNIPHKRHTIFRRENGDLCYEHLMGNKGFTGLASLLYHIRRPTAILKTRLFKECKWEHDPDPALRMRHFRTHRLPDTGPSIALDRTPLLYNNDVAISFAQPGENDNFFYRNSQGDELVFVSDGEGILESSFGELPFRKGDYLVIPRAITHRYRFAEGIKRLLIIESTGYFRAPKRYRNEHGQLLEHSPYCERDIRKPESLPVHDETGEFSIMVKKANAIYEVILEHHPFDIVGWDGYYYPWALNIGDFEPITGRIHQPPPVHQTFESDGFVVCSFVPRLFDYHPQSIPAPYQHSNIMSDEVIYYANDEFMSRKGIEHGSITLHPDGLPHGPQPGKTEESIGKTRTGELAVMIDTFQPLIVATDALKAEDKDYAHSWLEKRS